MSPAPSGYSGEDDALDTSALPKDYVTSVFSFTLQTGSFSLIMDNQVSKDGLLELSHPCLQFAKIPVLSNTTCFYTKGFSSPPLQGTERKLTDVVFSQLDATLQYRTASQNTCIDVSLGALYLHDMVTEGTLFPKIIEPVSRYRMLALLHPES